MKCGVCRKVGEYPLVRIGVNDWALCQECTARFVQAYARRGATEWAALRKARAEKLAKRDEDT